MNLRPQNRARSRRAFTLVELLVVITVILIVSIAGIAAALPAVRSQGVHTAALVLQAEFSRIHDEAVRANQPRGVRFLPELDGRFNILGTTPAYTRMIALEQGPDYSEGAVRAVILPATGTFLEPTNIATPFSDLPTASLSVGGGPAYATMIGTFNYGAAGTRKLWTTIWESKYDQIVGTIGIPRSPTSWYWNVRKGDKIRIGGGRELTIVGPDPIGLKPNPNFGGVANPERFINWGTGTMSTPSGTMPPDVNREFLIVLDGSDNDGDGYIDEAFDGIDNDGDGIIDPLFNGLDDNGNGLVDEPAEFALGEWELEVVSDLEPISLVLPGGAVPPPPYPPVDAQARLHTHGARYVISRRPVPAQGSREISLPSGVVIDLTTWATTQERSRLPIDPFTGYVDVMVAPNGQIVQPIAGRALPMDANFPFLHFWVTDEEDVFEPLATLPALPLSAGAYATFPTPQPVPAERLLKGHRRLVTINTRTGQITTTSLENFDMTGLTPATAALVLGRPYRLAESGVKEAP